MAVDLSFYKSWLSEEIRDEGREEGRAAGRAKGRAEGHAESILLVLEQRGLSVSDAVRTRVMECVDDDVLRRWLVRAVTVSSAEEIFQGD